MLTLPLLIALSSPVLALSEAEVLAKCDGMTRAGAIDSALKDGVIGGFAEKQCKTKAESARLDAELAKLNKETDQLIEILAMLDAREAKTYLKDEI